MDLPQKIRSLPSSAGVYLYKNAEGEVIYVGKANNLRSRVSSYFHEGRWEDAKTGTLVREAVDVDYIVVANNREALALENHLIKQKKPRFNILLRDDKTYPYVKLTLEGRQTDLVKSLRERMSEAAEAQEFERAARYRDLISTVEQLQEKQRIAAVEGDDADVFGYHYENQMLAVNLFHMRGGKVLDRREFFWEDLPEFGTDHVGADGFVRPGEQSSPTNSFRPDDFFSALVKQLYLAQPYVPRNIYVPVDFEDREELEEALSEQLAGVGARATRVYITVPQRGEKRELIDLAGTNAKQSYDQRFRVMKPNTRAIQEALQDALGLAERPERIECFDISHIQGAETVASMVVWEDGKMKKSDYRKFIIKTVAGVDDFASMREVVTRRNTRRREEKKLEEKESMPSPILTDGGLGQLNAAAQALEAMEIVNQPLAAIAKREEIIYVFGQEDEPVVLDHHSPVLHLVQMIRDEAHRFAVTFHRKRRQIRDRTTELREIAGVGESTTRRLLEHFGSLQAVKQADVAALSAVVTRSQAQAILEHFRSAQ